MTMTMHNNMRHRELLCSIHATMHFFLILLLVLSHARSANMLRQVSLPTHVKQKCKCGVSAAAAATAAVIATDADDTVDVANSVHASEHCNYRTTASDN